MKRLYYLFRGTQHAQSISNDLKKAGLDDGQLHFMNQSVAALKMADVHTTSVFEERDLQHTGLYGGMIGLGIGALFAFYLLATELGPQMNLTVFFVVCAIFTFFGAWTGGIVGISHDNHHISRFHEALEHGDTLLMLDTYNPQQEQKARDIMHSRHLEATFEGEDEHYKEFF